MNSGEDSVSAGRAASFLLQALGPRIRQHEGKIIDKLVGKYYSGKLTQEELYGGIAAIAEMRTFVRDLDTDRKKGEAALAQEHNR